MGDIVNSSRSQSTSKPQKKETSVFVTENDESELEKQKEDVLRKQQELELKLKAHDEELKRKDAAERAKRQQQALKEEEKLKKQQAKEEAENAKIKKENDEIRPVTHEPYELNELKEKERKKREKEYLEEEERKKRWISQSTINSIDQGMEKNSVDKAKKEELLAKLSIFNANDSKKIDTHSESNNSNQVLTRKFNQVANRFYEKIVLLSAASLNMVTIS